MLEIDILTALQILRNPIMPNNMADNLIAELRRLYKIENVVGEIINDMSEDMIPIFEKDGLYFEMLQKAYSAQP